MGERASPTYSEVRRDDPVGHPGILRWRQRGRGATVAHTPTCGCPPRSNLASTAQPEKGCGIAERCPGLAAAVTRLTEHCGFGQTVAGQPYVVRRARREPRARCATPRPWRWSGCAWTR